MISVVGVRQSGTGYGTEHVRAPRMILDGAERARVEAIVARGLETRPNLA